MNEEKEKAEKMIKAEIEKIKSDTKSNNSKLEMIEKEAVDLRQKKLHYQLELKDIYLIRLKEELKQENNDSITWILKAFWRIDKEFSNENFPSDLDSENINFLFKLAQMEQDLIDLKSKQRFEILSIAKDHGLKNSKGLLNREYTERLTEIQNKLKFMKKEKFQIKKTVANKVQHRTAIEKKLEEDLLEDYFKKCLGDLNIDDLEPKGSHNGEIKTEHKNYELQIKNIIEMIDQIKTKEILRMFHKFKHASLGDNDHKILSKILRILFGFKKNNEIMAMADFEKFKDDIRNKDMGLSSAEKNRPKTSKTFSSEKTRVDTAKTKKSNENNKERKEEIMKDYEGFFNKITIDSQTVNYKYNLNYNYTPKTNLEDDNRVFYTNNRVQTAKANKIVHF